MKGQRKEEEEEELSHFPQGGRRCQADKKSALGDLHIAQPAVMKSERKRNDHRFLLPAVGFFHSC